MTSVLIGCPVCALLKNAVQAETLLKMYNMGGRSYNVNVLVTQVCDIT